MMTRRHTKRAFFNDTFRYLLWIVAVSTLIAAGVRLVHDFTGPDHSLDPVPTATVPADIPAPVVPVAPSTIQEDDPRWDCAVNGNHICGPKSGHPAGCYRDGVLVIPWTQYTNPRLDPLWARLTPPC